MLFLVSPFKPISVSGSAEQDNASLNRTESPGANVGALHRIESGQMTATLSFQPPMCAHEARGIAGLFRLIEHGQD